MTLPAQCPFCGSSTVVAGHVDGVFAAVLNPTSFWPISGSGFYMGPAATFCAECCAVRTTVDRQHVAKFMKRYATDEPSGRRATIQVGAQCPLCGSRTVLTGKANWIRGFYLEQVRAGLVWSLRRYPTFGFGPAAQCCAECCSVWSKADPREAAKVVAKFANDQLKAQLATIQIGAKAAPEPPAPAKPFSQ